MVIDSYKFLPRSFRAGFEGQPMREETAVWAPLAVPVEEATIALMTSAGIYLKDEQEPFDLDRERENPRWGDPTYRLLPKDLRQDQVGAAHLHISTTDILEDFNTALPLRAYRALEADGAIGPLAAEHYGFMGFQENRAQEWHDHYGPEVIGRMKDAGVHALILAPA